MEKDFRLKIGEVSKEFGVSIRLLRYYDSIELLIPSFRDENGYRYYNKNDIIKLEQILLLQMLDFSLQDIKIIINRGNIAEELGIQKEFISNKIDYYSQKKDHIDKIINSDSSNLESITKNIKELYTITSGEFHNEEEAESFHESNSSHGDLIKFLRRMIDENYFENEVFEQILNIIPDLKNISYYSKFFTFLRLSNGNKFKLDEIDRIEKKMIKMCLSLDSTIM